MDVSLSHIELDMVQCMVGKCATLVDNLVESGPLPFQLLLEVLRLSTSAMQGWQVRNTCGQPCLSLASAIPTLLIASL